MSYYSCYINNSMVKKNNFLSARPEENELPLFQDVKDVLAQPFWEKHESYIKCYWKAWEIAFRNLRKATKKNGFISNYIDTAFNDCIFMWDSCFILLFARYGSRVFDFQSTLNNFYAKQHPDGFICREIREADGEDQFHRFDPSSTGPNILPWVEWEYFVNFGDKQRIEEVFPVLVAYHKWLREFRTWMDGSYWSSGMGCGMDNMKRVDPKYNEHLSHAHQVWVDTCLQQILSAKVIVKMSEVIGRRQDVVDFFDEIELLERLVNEKLWDENSSFYYDMWRGDKLNHIKSIGAYWALLAGIVPPKRLERFVLHLENPLEFKRNHRIPALSAEHSYYSKDGNYWNGGVWAPTNYMVLKGLSKNGYNSLAHEIAMNHLSNVISVFEKTGTLWENYSPDSNAPGTPARKDFVGWTGLTPIAVLFEYVFGLRPDVQNLKLTWDVRLLERHGVEKYPFGKEGTLNLACERRSFYEEKPVIKAISNMPVELVVQWKNGVESIYLEGS